MIDHDSQHKLTKGSKGVPLLSWPTSLIPIYSINYELKALLLCVLGPYLLYQVRTPGNFAPEPQADKRCRGKCAGITDMMINQNKVLVAAKIEQGIHA